MNLTPNQRLQLLALLDVAAIAPTCAKRTDEMAMGHPLVLGKLRDLGLADSQGVRRLGRQWTEYWLTPAGQREARTLKLQVA